MARAKPANQPSDQVETTEGPVIEYVDEGAENVKFTADPNAKLIRVFSSGQVTYDY